MGRRRVSVTSLILIFIGVLGLAVNVQKVETSGTVYIRADGSVDPETAPIQRDGNLYTFTDDIFDGIVVEKDNIVIDGAGYTLQGTGADYSEGIDLTGRSNVAIKNMEIRAFWDGIWLQESSNNRIYENHITATIVEGIGLFSSSNNHIYGNNIAANDGTGIALYDSSDNHVYGNSITDNYIGIFLSYSLGEGCFDNTIYGNNIAINKGYGIQLQCSSGNSVYENRVTDNWSGVILEAGSDNNSVYRNNITNNFEGIGLYTSENNTICHNNFVNNAEQAWVNAVNVWDDCYPPGGNYWSNYTEADFKSGSGQDELGSDGIGDAPYEIFEDNQDRYPLMGPFNTFDAGTWAETAYSVDVVSSSQVSEFYFNPEEGPFIRFDVTGQDETTGFCRATIPKDLLWVEDGWTILVGGEPVTDYKIIPDQNHTYLYFSYQHSTKTVEIQGTHVIPEFPSIIILPLIMIATLIAVTPTKRHQTKT